MTEATIAAIWMTTLGTATATIATAAMAMRVTRPIGI